MTCSPARIHEIGTDAFAARSRSTCSAPTAWSRLLPGMVERRRGDIVFVCSDVATASAPAHGRLRRRQGRPERWWRNLQMELEGTGVRARSCGPARPDRDGLEPVRRTGRADARRLGELGLARHDYFLRASDIARAVAIVAETPRGAHLVNIEVEPEAPLKDAAAERHQLKLEKTECRHDVRVGRATAERAPRPPGRRGGAHGHLEELRTDPIGLMQRVREECGDVGTFRLADKDVVLLSGAEANEVFFRAPDEDLDQAEAYPFMTPIFGEGVVFDASPGAAQGDAAQPGAARRADARPRRDHRARGRPDGRRLGRRGRDRPARLVRRADDLHVVGVPDRQEVPRAARRPVRAPLPRARAGTDALAYVDPYADIESFRRRDAARGGLVELVQGIMDGRMAEPARGQGATATCSTC